MIHSKRSIRSKLQTIILIVSFSSIFLGFIVFISWYISNQKKQSVATVQTVAQVLSQNFAKLLFLDDINEAADITTILHAYPKIENLVLYNKNRDAVYMYAKNKKSFTPIKLQNITQEYETIGENKLLLVYKLYYQNMHIGYMYSEMRIESISKIIIDNLLFFIAILFILILFSSVLAYNYAKSFSEPIMKLVEFLGSVDLTQEKEQKMKTQTDTKEFWILFEKINQLLRANKEANKKLKIASVAFEIDSGMIITDATYKVLQVNSAYTAITGYSQQDVIGDQPPVFKERLENKKVYKLLDESLHKHNYWNGDIKAKKKNGSVFIEHLSIYAVTNSDKNISHYIFSILDVTKQKNIENKLKFLQEYDSLTGLANKTLITRKIDKNISNRGVFISLDIKKFKEINMLYGYETGDLLLKEVASRIKNVFPDAVVIGRVESNQFIVYTICSKTIREEILLDAKEDAEYLFSLLQEKSFVINNNTFAITIAIGVILTKEKDNAKILFDKGHHILEVAKEKGESIVFFDEAVNKNAIIQENLYPQLLKAIKNGELELYYQLQYDAKQNPYAAEALIRWNHPKKGLVSPALFIPLAEKTGLISQIGRLVIELACKQLCEWQKNLFTKDLLISINIGANHFQESDFKQQVENIMKAYDFPRHNLKIELTEYTLINNIEEISHKMQVLKSMGIQISLDDFGTGFSSLQYLQLLPIDQLKIDQVFVMNILKDKTDAAIVKFIIMLGKELDLEVIAEGVENEALYKKLSEFGCQYFQGYYFAKPQNISMVNEKLKMADSTHKRIPLTNILASKPVSSILPRS